MPSLPSPLHHPASLAPPPDVRDRIQRAWLDLPATYAPRTRHHGGVEHRDQHTPEAPAGAQPNYANRLLLQASPYLRQHAHNPVDWRPWGQAAFDEARALGRPIFLSIGYATCHWCHVMEHESFEDLEIAALLNELYVPVKVDREERPDVDAVHMAAVQATTGHGGWPMSVWLAPEPQGTLGLPFFCGTYFPPRRGVRGARHGFDDVLRAMHEAWVNQREAVTKDGRQVADAVHQYLQTDATTAQAGGTLDASDAHRAVVQAVAAMDWQWGGRRGAPKFPSQIPVRLLVADALHSGDAEPVEAAALTLLRMAQGGIHDHVGGGWHRYSTDLKWFAPHFEKMLYDQALITLSLLDLSRVHTGDWIPWAARRTVDYLLRELRHPGGAFYAATDADSEGVEGTYFTWTVDELVAVLGPQRAQRVAERYQVTEHGNFHGEHGEFERGRNIVHLRPDDNPMPDPELGACLEALRSAREARVPPLRDEKILSSWNGLAVSAVARAGQRLGEPTYVRAAETAADWLLRHLLSADGRLLRGGLDGQGTQTGFLDDYAFVTAGLLDLAEVTGKARWLRAAVDLHGQLERWFSDPRGGWWQTPVDAEALLARPRPDHDGAEPSGNSVAAMNALRLYQWLGEPQYLTQCDAALASLAAQARAMPMGQTELLRAVQARSRPLREVVVVLGAEPQEEDTLWYEAITQSKAIYDLTIVVRDGQDRDELAAISPLLQDRRPVHGRATAWVCRDGACLLPTTDVVEFAALLARE